MSREQQNRILIVDDDPDITITLLMSLENNGFKADSYTDVVLAFENYVGGLYDLVLLDIKMPGDGFQLYQNMLLNRY